MLNCFDPSHIITARVVSKKEIGNNIYICRRVNKQKFVNSKSPLFVSFSDTTHNKSKEKPPRERESMFACTETQWSRTEAWAYIPCSRPWVHMQNHVYAITFLFTWTQPWKITDLAMKDSLVGFQFPTMRLCT